MTERLAEKTCQQCVGATQSLPVEQQKRMLAEVAGWAIIDDHHLERQYTFKNFKQALAFVNQIAEVAESQQHHPDIFFTWGKVKVNIMTHSVDGLTEADFVLAAKINVLTDA